jgi:hypothetical protein
MSRKAPITDPRDPTLARWLATLEPAEEYVIRLALRGIHPIVRADRTFAARVDVLFAELKPNTAQLSQFMTASRIVGERLRGKLDW